MRIVSAVFLVVFMAFAVAIPLHIDENDDHYKILPIEDKDARSGASAFISLRDPNEVQERLKEIPLERDRFRILPIPDENTRSIEQIPTLRTPEEVRKHLQNIPIVKDEEGEGRFGILPIFDKTERSYQKTHTLRDTDEMQKRLENIPIIKYNF